MSGGASIELHDVAFRFGEGDFLLRLPQWSVAAGARVAVVGPSGCGKTTLLNLLAGILLPDEGSIRVDGEELSGRSDGWLRDFRCARIGQVFQEFELLDYLDVHENILLPFLINRSLKLNREASLRARDLAERMGLGDKRTRRVDQLSQGERQRVGICRALVAEPRLLLADEPTGNLDAATTKQIIDLLIEHARRTGATLVTVTHDAAILDHFERVDDLASRFVPQSAPSQKEGA